MNKGKQFEKKIREYFSNRSDTEEVFRDSYGTTDICVVFENKIYLIEAKAGDKPYLKEKEKEGLKNLAKSVPENAKIWVYCRKDPSKSCGKSNWMRTWIKKEDPEGSLERYRRKWQKSRENI